MMLKYLIISVFFHLISGEQTLQCGDWEEYKDKTCLKVFNNTFVQNYFAAKNTCYQNEASSLVSIHTQEEQDFVLNLIYTKHKIVNDVLIGADYRNNTFHWSDNATANYTNWANGYPKANSDYECVSMGYVDPIFGKWLNEPCDKMNSVVCQKKQNWLFSYLQNTVMEMRDTIENLTTHLNNTNLALINTRSELDYYKLELKYVLTNASTGCSLSQEWAKCDSFVDFRTNTRQVLAMPKSLSKKFQTHDNALSVCTKHNATLVSIESVEKQLFIENFFQSNRTKFWSSGYSSAEDKKWRWINGNELSYTNWSPGQPDNGYPVEPCMEVNYDKVIDLTK